MKKNTRVQVERHLFVHLHNFIVLDSISEKIKMSSRLYNKKKSFKLYKTKVTFS